jgi:hypothetical protein
MIFCHFVILPSLIRPFVIRQYVFCRSVIRRFVIQCFVAQSSRELSGMATEAIVTTDQESPASWGSVLVIA